MPNLEQRAVTEWLESLRPNSQSANWPPAIRTLEVSGSLPTDLAELGHVLDSLSEHDLARLRDAVRQPALRDRLQAVMAQFGAARALRIMHWMSEVNLPECHQVLADLVADDSRAARALRATLGAVTRTATVNRMFAPDRIAALEHACNAIKEEV